MRVGRASETCEKSTKQMRSTSSQDLAIWPRSSQSAGLALFRSASASHVEAQTRAGGSVHLAPLEFHKISTSTATKTYIAAPAAKQ